MPFGLQLKSVLVGVIIALWVYPFIANLIMGMRSKPVGNVTA